MIGLLQIGYVLGVVLTTYPAAMAVRRSLMDDLPGVDLDSADRTFAGFLGVGIASLWPLALTGYVLYRTSRRMWQAIDQRDEARR